MPLYVVKPDSLELERSYERSLVISLLTDASSEDDIPGSLKKAVDRVAAASGLSVLKNGEIPAGSSAAFLWMAGDKLLAGSGLDLRRTLLLAGHRCLVPVHLPCLPELDLIGLQPRIWKQGPHLDSTQPHLRIAAAAAPSPQLEEVLADTHELWARLYLALLAEQKNPGAGIEELSRMWQDSTAIPHLYASLLLRNLVVLLVRHRRYDEAKNLLKIGMDCYPRYAELPFLAAWLCAFQEQFAEVLRYTRQAMKNADPTFLGSGGEYSYRSLWLFAWVSELAGKQSMAAPCYLSGVQARPAFPPSLMGLLRQRLPYQTAHHMQLLALAGLARREPEYLEMIFRYLLLHRQIQAAHRVLALSEPTHELREKLQKLFDEATAACRPQPFAAGDKPGVRLIGPFYVHSSLARINREIAAALMGAEDLDAALEPHGYGEVPGSALPHHPAIAKGLWQQLRRLDLTIRQHWPPDFRPPDCGKLVLILPWEFGSVPQKWVEQIEKSVDELWVPSEFNRAVFVRGGVSPERVQVIPYGMDPDIFQPEGPSWRPEGCRSFVFLFVGGAIPRKGADILLKAYRMAFSPADDATLVVKDIGSSTFYRHMSLVEQLNDAARDPRSPHLIVLTEEIDDAKLAALYRGSNVFVLPYRGEGFGMPLAEAIACGKPVITTGLGPAREFCPSEAAQFLSAKEIEIPSSQLQFGPMTGPYTWFEPDVKELARLLREAFERREKPQMTAASEKVRRNFNWNEITRQQLERVRRLTGQMRAATHSPPPRNTERTTQGAG